MITQDLLYNGTAARKLSYDELNALSDSWKKLPEDEQKRRQFHEENFYRFPDAFSSLFFNKYFFVRLKNSGCIYKVSGHYLNPVMKKIGTVKGFEHLYSGNIGDWEKVTNGTYIMSRPSIRSFCYKNAEEINAYMFDEMKMFRLLSKEVHGPYISLFNSRRREIIIPREYQDCIDHMATFYDNDYTTRVKTLVRKLSEYAFSEIVVEKECDPVDVYHILEKLNDSCEFLYKFLNAPKNFVSLFGRISIVIVAHNKQHVSIAADYGTYMGQDTIRIKMWGDGIFFHEWMHAFDNYYSHLGRDNRYELSFTFDNEYTERDKKATMLRKVLLGEKNSPSVMLSDGIRIDDWRNRKNGFKSAAYFAKPKEIYARAFACFMVDAAATDNKDGKYGCFHPNVKARRFFNIYLYDGQYLDYLDEIDASVGDDIERDAKHLHATEEVRNSQKPIVYPAIKAFFDEVLSDTEELVRGIM